MTYFMSLFLSSRLSFCLKLLVCLSKVTGRILEKFMDVSLGTANSQLTEILQVIWNPQHYIRMHYRECTAAGK